MLSVNNNADASLAARMLGLTSRELGMTNGRISTGYKVGSASDNASTFGLAQMMRGDVAAMKQMTDSINTNLAVVNVASNTAQQISDKLNQIKTKVTEAQDPTVDRATVQSSITTLLNEVDSLATAASFNGVNMIKAGGSSLVATTAFNRTSTTAVSVATTTIAAQNMSSAGLGIAGINVSGNTSVNFAPDNTAAIANGNTFSFTVGGVAHVFEFTDGTAALTTTTTATQQAHAVLFTAADSLTGQLTKMFTAMGQFGFSGAFKSDGSFDVQANATITAVANTATGITAGAIGANPSAALTTIENGINSARTSLAALGIGQNALQAQADFTKALVEQLNNGLSSMVDADLTEESANLSALQTKNQLGMQAISIANQSHSAILSLFK